MGKRPFSLTKDRKSDSGLGLPRVKQPLSSGAMVPGDGADLTISAVVPTTSEAAYLPAGCAREAWPGAVEPMAPLPTVLETKIALPPCLSEALATSRATPNFV